MLNIDELVVYLIIIIGLLVIIQLYNKIHPKVSPIWEGLTNSTDDTATKNGYTTGSNEFNQDIAGMIAVNEVELKVNKYSNQYLEILNNLKELFARRALKEILTSSTYPERSIIKSQWYKGGIDLIDQIIPILFKSNMSSSNMSSFTPNTKITGNTTTPAKNDNEDEPEEKPKSWIPSW